MTKEMNVQHISTMPTARLSLMNSLIGDIIFSATAIVFEPFAICQKYGRYGRATLYGYKRNHSDN
jgi:hypothetical protein